MYTQDTQFNRHLEEQTASFVLWNTQNVGAGRSLKTKDLLADSISPRAFRRWLSENTIITRNSYHPATHGGSWNGVECTSKGIRRGHVLDSKYVVTHVPSIADDKPLARCNGWRRSMLNGWSLIVRRNDVDVAAVKVPCASIPVYSKSCLRVSTFIDGLEKKTHDVTYVDNAGVEHDRVYHDVTKSHLQQLLVEQGWSAKDIGVAMSMRFTKRQKFALMFAINNVYTAALYTRFAFACAEEYGFYDREGCNLDLEFMYTAFPFLRVNDPERGNRCLAREGEVMTLVMIELAKQGIPCMTHGDAVSGPVKFAEQIKSAMLKAWSSVLGTSFLYLKVGTDQVCLSLNNNTHPASIKETPARSSVSETSLAPLDWLDLMVKTTKRSTFDVDDDTDEWLQGR